LVEKLVEGGLASLEELGKVVVEREQPAEQPGAPTGATLARREAHEHSSAS
jgi:hypothetical protein